VIVADAVEELARVAADGLAIAVVGGAEAAGHHAADVLTGFQQDNRLALARRCHGRDRAGRRGGVDDDVGRRALPTVLLPSAGNGGKTEDRNERNEGNPASRATHGQLHKLNRGCGSERSVNSTSGSAAASSSRECQPVATAAARAPMARAQRTSSGVSPITQIRSGSVVPLRRRWTSPSASRATSSRSK